MIGEGNAGPGVSAASERAAVAAVINQARVDLSAPAMRHVLCYLSESTQTFAPAYVPLVNDGFDLRVVEDGGLTLPVTTDGLETGADQTHFTPRARLEIGRRAAVQILASW
jgi:hypothetical protein